ncbi:hypothetical protein V502_05334, partial [Pseudogymnoascus sp. VKM F-4520 (FW-2644)]
RQQSSSHRDSYKSHARAFPNKKKPRLFLSRPASPRALPHHPQAHDARPPPPVNAASAAPRAGPAAATTAAPAPLQRRAPAAAAARPAAAALRCLPVRPRPAAAVHPERHRTPSATGTYTSAAADTPDIIAAAGMARPLYPPIYHTPQSNSPASVASPSGHDQHGRQIYSQPPSQMQQQQPMYYPPPPQTYPPMPQQGNPSPYGQQQPQHHQGMGPQSNLLMSHPQAQHQMQHPGQHPQQMTSSPRVTKMEHPPQQQQQRTAAAPPQGQPQPPHTLQHIPPATNGAPPLPGTGVNPSAAPGPIPATTPLVVRQDGNGVQWIAFEYSRDRVKMEYTIRCDVESVAVDSLAPEFKTENCVYPRACCSKDQYRGNRLVYESECNTVGWALAELNPCLRGKRGLIQRAVDSWRNSNQDPRLRSRRVRRMAKINSRKLVHAAPLGLPPGAPPGPLPVQQQQQQQQGKMGAQMHHHHQAHADGAAAPNGDDGSDFRARAPPSSTSLLRAALGP